MLFRKYTTSGVLRGMQSLKAPFPFFGGKSGAAKEVWAALGPVENYVEPFAGSLAVFLARPTPPKEEVVNDLDGHIANVWRSIQLKPEEVVKYASGPVIEVDQHARHLWLVGMRESLTEKLSADFEFCDPKAAGFWVHGAYNWIGSGWCLHDKPSKQLPRISSAGFASREEDNFLAWIQALSKRLAKVKICNGDWARVLSPSVTWDHYWSRHNGNSGIFFDPPYSDKASKCKLYKGQDFTVSAAVRQWCKDNGHHKALRIVLAGFEGEGHEELEALGWRCVPWFKPGFNNRGYAIQSEAGTNQGKERLWLSPHCLQESSLEDWMP